MKKTVLLFLSLVFALFLVSGAGAYTVTVTDPVGDQIGVAGFDITGLTFNVNEPFKVAIDTNYPKDGILVSAWQTVPGDLLLDGAANGVGWDYAIPLVGANSGQLFSLGTLFDSNNFAPSGGGYLFGGNYPVAMASGASMGSGFTGTWIWGSGAINYVANNWYWSDITTPGDFLTVSWAATCANDIISGGGKPPAVPEPATMLLLGCGLVGLAGFRRKFRQS